MRHVNSQPATLAIRDTVLSCCATSLPASQHVASLRMKATFKTKQFLLRIFNTTDITEIQFRGFYRDTGGGGGGGLNWICDKNNSDARNKRWRAIGFDDGFQAVVHLKRVALSGRWDWTLSGGNFCSEKPHGNFINKIKHVETKYEIREMKSICNRRGDTLKRIKYNT